MADTAPIRKLKQRGSGIHMLGHDGVFCSFDGSPNVIDAEPLSPAQIKRMLDQMPWDQETEDRFRGVDGRKITDHKEMFDPEDESLRPVKLSEEEKERVRKEVDEHNRKLAESIERRRREGVGFDAKYACGRNRSDYNLDPK